MTVNVVARRKHCSRTGGLTNLNVFSLLFSQIDLSNAELETRIWKAGALYDCVSNNCDFVLRNKSRCLHLHSIVHWHLLRALSLLSVPRCPSARHSIESIKMFHRCKNNQHHILVRRRYSTIDTFQSTSRSHEGLSMTLPENLDYIVMFADAAPREYPAAKRSQRVLDQPQRTCNACNVGLEHHLAYRPQSVPSQTEGFAPPNTGVPLTSSIRSLLG